MHPNRMPKDSPEYKAWLAKFRKALPQCQSKDSEEYSKWQEATPSCHPKESPIRQKWERDTIATLPQVQPKNSEEYKQWVEKNPASMSKDSDAYQKWHKLYAINALVLKAADSEEFLSWKSTLPQYSGDGKEIWHENMIDSAPQCKDKGSEEYSRWKELTPQMSELESTEFKEWLEKNRAVHLTKYFVAGQYESVKGTNRNSENLIWYRSSYELAFLETLAADENVMSFVWEPFELSYMDKDVKRSYTPDVLVYYVDGIKKLVEVKPREFTTKHSVQLKAASGRAWCEENNAFYEFWDPRDQ